MSKTPFILASASTARSNLLKTAGIQPIISPSNFDESTIIEPDPSELVKTLAHQKAQTIAKQSTNALILGCDSILVINQEIHGKPKSAEEAIARWKQMRGHHGDLYTGHAIIDLINHQTLVEVAITRIYFSQISDQEIIAYVKTKEPLNCAGAFAIDGLGGLFIDRIEGCHTNVIGLSLPLLRKMLAQLQWEIINFWST